MLGRLEIRTSIEFDAMIPEICKLKSLYQQFDQQQTAGEDVVAELKKEINNGTIRNFGA